MKLRNVGVFALVIAAAVACDRGQDRAKPEVTAVPQGGSADPWSKQEPKKDPLARPLFWKLEKDGVTSYLLGTMHVGVDPIARLPQIVWDRLDAAKTFAMEVDPTDMNIDVTRKDGKTLRDELGPAYWKKLEDALGASTAQRMLSMKAMIPATLLSVRALPETPGMDKELHARAQRQNKKIVYLETLALEIAALDTWMDARALKDMLDDMPAVEQHTKDMLAAYLAGDEVKMQALVDSERAEAIAKGRPAKEYDAIMEEVLYGRNASWIAPIEKLHAEGGGFVAMGASHAIGPRGVLDLLEKKGFKITRITP